MGTLKLFAFASAAIALFFTGCSSGPDTQGSDTESADAQNRLQYPIWGPKNTVTVPDVYSEGNFEVRGRTYMEAPYLEEVGHHLIVYPDAALTAPMLKRVSGAVILMEGARIEAPLLTGAQVYSDPASHSDVAAGPR